MGRRLLVAAATAATVVVVAFTLLEVALPGHGGASTYATASAAIAIATVVAGLSSGLMATGLSGLVATFGHLPPVRELHVDDAADLTGLLIFMLNGAVVAAAISYVRSRGPSEPGGLRPGIASYRGSVASPGGVVQARPSLVPLGAGSTTALIEPLTDREVEVLECLAEGMANAEIASTLFVSVNTVKTHLKNAYGKLGVTSRTKATARARDLGIIGSVGLQVADDPFRRKAA